MPNQDQPKGILWYFMSSYAQNAAARLAANHFSPEVDQSQQQTQTKEKIIRKVNININF
jgi:hypothetical protein